MAYGKPLFKNPDEVKRLADEYFAKFPKIEEAETDADKLKAKEYQNAGILPTMSGLCIKLGFYSWEQWNIYEQKKIFRSTFQALRLRLLSYWEGVLPTGRGAQGVSAWINYVTGGSFLGKSADFVGSRGAVAVVVVGADGSRQALSDILTAANTPQIQQVKTIDTTAQEVKSKPRKASKASDKRAEANKRKARLKTLKRLAAGK